MHPNTFSLTIAQIWLTVTGMMLSTFSSNRNHLMRIDKMAHVEQYHQISIYEGLLHDEILPPA
jgi:hypothetical protein